MASSPLVLPGVVFVGEDDRQRITAHTGPAAGWMIPKGILQWSTEVSLVAREALTDEVRRETKAVMPEEQIPAAKYPLTVEAAKRSPLVAVSSKLTPKLNEKNVRVHTVGVDRMTSSFFYIGEGGGEESITVSGDLVQAVAEMLGERADNAAIERVLDSLVDRLLRSLSKNRVDELSVELAASLPRMAADGSGAQGVDLDAFEKDLAALVARSEKYATPLQEIADKITGATERKLDVPLYGDARKVPQGPFDLTVGDRKIALGTYERWVLSGPFTEPGPKRTASSATAAAAVAAASAVPAASPKPKPVEAKLAAVPAPSPQPKTVESKPAPAPSPSRPRMNEVKPPSASPTPAPAKAQALAPPMSPAKPEPVAEPAPEPKVEAKPAPAPEPKMEAKPEPAPEPKVEAKPEPAPEPKAEAKPEPAPEPKKAEPEKKVEKAEKTEKAKEAKSEAKAKPAESSSRALEKEDRESTAPEKAAERKGGFPWLAVLIAIAVAIVVYQVMLAKK